MAHTVRGPSSLFNMENARPASRGYLGHLAYEVSRIRFSCRLPCAAWLELDPVYGMDAAMRPPPCKRISYGEVFLSSCLRAHAKFIVFVASSEKLRLDESTSIL
jgi:hypothetical protein